jgi:probable F420-dependent oxidoreductase
VTRLGVTLPLEGLELYQHRAAIERLSTAGYVDLWSGEVNGIDGLSQLALYAGWNDHVGIACGVVNAFTRPPALLAMSAAAMGELAPGRARFGIGAGSDVIVHNWNGIPFETPYTRVSEALEFVQAALRGERSEGEYKTFASRGFKLSRIPATPPLLLVAALGPRMLKLAASRADGVVLNFLSAGDLDRIHDVTDNVKREEAPLEVSARVFVVPGDDRSAEIAARRHIAGYLTVPVYAQYQRWLGRERELTPLWDAWAAGDRKRAVDVIPQEVVDDLVLYGSPRDCASGIRRYMNQGLDALTVGLMPAAGTDPTEQVDFLVDLGNELAVR